MFSMPFSNGSSRAPNNRKRKFATAVKALLAKVLGRTGLENKNSVTAERRKTNSTGKQGRQKGAIRRKNTGGVCGRPSIPGDASVDDIHFTKRCESHC